MEDKDKTATINNLGNKISYAWNFIKGHDYIVFKGPTEVEILKISKLVWDKLKPKSRDEIVEKIRNMFG